MMIAATLFNASKEERMKWVKYYDAISNFDINNYASYGRCTYTKDNFPVVLVETDDDLDSINATSSAIVKYVRRKQVLVLAQVHSLVQD